MKPLKDLAELNHPRINSKALTQFNTLIENIRISACNEMNRGNYGSHLRDIIEIFEFMDKLELITPESKRNRSVEECVI